MKLPVGKKERMILFSAIGGMAVLALFGIVQWGILPLFESRRVLTEQVEAEREKLKKAKRQLDYAPGLRKNFDEVVERLARIRSENVLRPILGSYLVGVSERVESAARETGVKIEDVREVGIREMPRKTKPLSPPTFKEYDVQVYALGSFDALGRFLRKMEDQHPFMCARELQIAGQPDDPEVQRLMARLEWPIEPSTETAKGVGP